MFCSDQGRVWEQVGKLEHRVTRLHLCTRSWPIIQPPQNTWHSSVHPSLGGVTGNGSYPPPCGLACSSNAEPRSTGAL